MDASPQQTITRKMWKASWLFAGLVFCIGILYEVAYRKGNISLLSFATATAASAAICIGFSFALSGFAYFFDFLDTKIAYRKYLGLVGFWLALAYSALLVGVAPEKYAHGLPTHFFSADVLLGISAMALLTYMALISNQWAMKWLGALRWRKHLRIGYLAYALLVARAVVVEKQLWLDWLQSSGELPPPRLLVTIFAVSVVCLRAFVLVSSWRRKKNAQQLQTPKP